MDEPSVVDESTLDNTLRRTTQGVNMCEIRATGVDGRRRDAGAHGDHAMLSRTLQRGPFEGPSRRCWSNRDACIERFNRTEHGVPVKTCVSVALYVRGPSELWRQRHDMPRRHDARAGVPAQTSRHRTHAPGQQIGRRLLDQLRSQFNARVRSHADLLQGLSVRHRAGPRFVDRSDGVRAVPALGAQTVSCAYGAAVLQAV